jgi:hypothetical protein
MTDYLAPTLVQLTCPPNSRTSVISKRLLSDPRSQAGTTVTQPP